MKHSFLFSLICLSTENTFILNISHIFVFSLLAPNLKYFLYFFFIIFVSRPHRIEDFLHIFGLTIETSFLYWMQGLNDSLPSEIQKIVVKFDMWSCPEPIYSSEWKSYYVIQLQEPTWFPSQRTCHQRQLWNVYYSVQKYCAGFSYSVYWKPGKIIIIFF